MTMRPAPGLQALRATAVASVACAVSMLAWACDAVAAGPAFSSATEAPTTSGWQPITEKLAAALVARGDPTDRAELDDTIHSEHLPRNLRQFFVARPVPLSDGGLRTLFVRPPTEPYYQPFYGAHTFRFWVVDARGRILLAAQADRFAVLGSVHEGMHDVLVSQCRGGFCYDTTAAFHDGAYRDGACVTRTIDGGATTPQCH